MSRHCDADHTQTAFVRVKLTIGSESCSFESGTADMYGKLKALLAAGAIAAIAAGVQPAKAQVYYTINGQAAAPDMARRLRR